VNNKPCKILSVIFDIQSINHALLRTKGAAGPTNGMLLVTGDFVLLIATLHKYLILFDSYCISPLSGYAD